MFGEFEVTLDAQGRIRLPASLRKHLNEASLYYVMGMENCLQLYPSGAWNEMENAMMNNADSFPQKDCDLYHRIMSSKQEVKIDKAGRILIVPALREYAGISKECVVSGMGNYIEIWGKEHWQLQMNEITSEEVDLLKGKLSGI